MPQTRAVVVPKFGAYLRKARGQLAPNVVVVKMHRASPALGGFTRPQLDRYESGQTPRPDPVALYHLARLYGVPLGAMVEVLVLEREHLETRKDVSQGEAPAVRKRASSG